MPRPEPLDLLLAALAVWRLGLLLTRERGPFDVFLCLRTRAGIEHDEEGRPLRWSENRFWPSLLSCLWCCSVWCGVGCTLLLLVAPFWAVWIFTPLALSAAALLFERLMSYG